MRRRGELDFEVHFGETKTFLLRAESAHDLQHWMDAFEAVTAKLRRPGAVGSDGDEADGAHGQVPLEDLAGVASPSQQVLQRIHETKRERHLQSSPTSPLQLGPGSEASDSRPESAVGAPAGFARRLGVDGDGGGRVEDRDTGGAKVSPRTLLANPAKAFGGFFAPPAAPRAGAGSPGGGARGSFCAEETSVVPIQGGGYEDRAAGLPTRRADASASASASKKGGELPAVDNNWIDEDFDADSDDDEAGAAPDAQAPPPPAAHGSHARRSLDMDRAPPPPQVSTLGAYGAVQPDPGNWVEEDWDSE